MINHCKSSSILKSRGHPRWMTTCYAFKGFSPRAVEQYAAGGGLAQGGLVIVGVKSTLSWS